jgi:hypothetical protein
MWSVSRKTLRPLVRPNKKNWRIAEGMLVQHCYLRVMLKFVIHFYSEGEITTILQEYRHAFLFALRAKLAKYLLLRKMFQTKGIGKNVTRLIDDTPLP